VETIPPEAFLAAYPEPMRRLAESLRAVVVSALPDAVERVRPGWRLIGYDVPVAGRRTRYVCFVLPEAGHVHLGFEYGVLMADPDGLLAGAGITRRVRWLTFCEGDTVEPALLVPFVLEAARVATLSPDEQRLALATIG
jgi:hypothetical protein